MKTIIVPVDFSNTASNAAEFAGNIALFYGAEIWLYHSYEAPVALSEFAYPVFDVAEMQKAAEFEMEKIKAETLAKLRSPVNIHCQAEMNILEIGLANFCKKMKPDLVVMGLSGKNALTRLIVGSNTIKAIYSIPYPILVVPPQAQFEPVYKLGFAVDYEKIQNKVPLELLKKITRDFNSELHVLNIDFKKKDFTPEMVKGSFAIYDWLEEEKPIYHNIEAADINAGVNKFAESTSISWIVVIPRKHALIQKIFSRSHTQDLLFHTSIPVLCIHE